MTQQYDLVVLGAGPGGYIAAIRAAQLGLKTAVVEKEYWGGVCANIGCIPTKALLHNAELVHTIQHKAAAFGIHFNGDVQFDYAAAYQRSRQAAERMAGGVQTLMKKNQIDRYDGWATLQDAHHMAVVLNSGQTTQLQFKHLIIAAGATDKTLPNVPLSDRVTTYKAQILADHLPQSIIIVGAGAIGVEFSYILANYGVQVTLIEYLDRILPLEDQDVSRQLYKAYRRLGIQVLTAHRVDGVDERGEDVAVTATNLAQNKAVSLTAERVMIATGFRPRTDGYGLENTGVMLTEDGAIAIDEQMRSNIPHIYAIGDVTGKRMLAHVAEAMGVVAAEQIAGLKTYPLDYIMMPRATYCQPQVASFGYTEEEARTAGYQINVAKFPFAANGKAVGLDDTAGFVKLISDQQYGELLGAHMIGPSVTELLPELTLAQQLEATPQEIAHNVHAHPTLSEAIKEAAHGLEGHMLNF